MTGNISKSKGFKGVRGDIGPRGPQGEKGDTANLYLRYDPEKGDLYYTTEHIPSITTAPYIGDNGNWYVFDGISQTFIDSGVNAQGDIPKAYIDEYIDRQTTVIKSDIDGLQKHINEESHFRGYLSTNAKVQALEATPNDFAYSAESGTKWVYDKTNGWEDTGSLVPDQLTPASDTTPLINGIASIGTETAYSRGDHRHPTDTTRASVEELRALESKVQPYVIDIIENSEVLLDGNAQNGIYRATANRSPSVIAIAYRSGRTNMVVKYKNQFLPLVYIDETMCDFAGIKTNSKIYIQIMDDDGLAIIHINALESTGNKVSEITNEVSDVKYPSALAVKNYVDDRLSGQSAEVEEAIDRIIAIQNTLIGGGSE